MVKVAKEDNLIPEAHKLTVEEQSAGGRRSAEVRREKATMKKTLEMLLDETNSKTKKTYRELSTLGLIKGATQGKAENYKLIMQIIGELQDQEEQKGTPVVNINIVDNSDLEKALYEDEDN